MVHAEQEAQKLERHRLTVGVDSWNSAAIAFYTALGYVRFKEAQGPTPDQKVFYLKKELDGWLRSK